MKTTNQSNTVYIPQQVDELLSRLDYKRKDDLYIICDLIYRRQIYFKSKLQKSYGYINIPFKRFAEIIGKYENAKKAVDFLIEHHIIFRNDFFNPETGQAKGYKIANELLGKKVPYTITTANINKRLTKKREELRKVKVKGLEFAQSKYFTSFTIDREGALKAATDKAIYDIYDLCAELKYSVSYGDIVSIIECTGDFQKHRALILVRPKGKELHNILHRYMVHQIQINSLCDGWLYFKRNKTNNRLDTNLTSLPSYLRKYIISDDELFNVDIKNSQPFFLYTQLKTSEVNADELALYGDLVTTGTLYEYLAGKYKELEGKDKTRDEMKQMLFKIFYSNLGSYANYKRFFGQVFPSIMEYINTTNKDSNKILANKLQTIESFTILDVVMKELDAIDITPFTIHDSFICTKSELKAVVGTINRVMMELHAMKPELHQNSLIDSPDDFEAELEFDDDYDFGDIDDFLTS